MTLDMGTLGMNTGNSFQQVVFIYGEDPEEQERQLRFREKEDNRMRELQKKQVEEIEAKNQRRQRARAKLQDMLKASEALKLSKAQERASKSSNATNSQGNSWQTVVNNIALKNGDFPGTKDISRMRDAIVNKAKDNN